MIDILLPLYNGEKFLSQQLDSILRQTYTDWRILVRDDGSSDASISIIREYIKKNPHKFILIEDTLGNLGTTGCLDLLLKNVSSDYFMYCDQDDVWESNKIEMSFSEMLKMEGLYPNKPILVCSDACCIDEKGRLLHSSFFINQKFIDTTDDFHKTLALNVVQGSTALMNKAVRDIIVPIPLDLYHDWWTAVNVVYYGKISYIHLPLLRYRQHRTNVVGALNVGSRYLTKKLVSINKQMKVYLSMYRQLPFKPSIVKWVYYKLMINIQRF